MVQREAPDTSHKSLIRWTVGDVAKGIGVVVGVTILVAIGLAIGTVVLVGLEGIGDGSADMGSLVEALSARGVLEPWLVLLLAAMVVGEGAMPLSAWLFSGLKHRCGWSALGFRRFRALDGLLLTGMVVVGGVLVSFLYDLLVTSLGMEAPTNWPSELTQSGLGLAVMAALAVAVAPVAEETFFRGFVLGGIGKRFGYGWGAVVSALLFSVAHMQLTAFVPIFILGLLLAWLYVKTGSIWPCILTHAAYNSIALVFMI